MRWREGWLIVLLAVATVGPVYSAVSLNAMQRNLDLYLRLTIDYQRKINMQTLKSEWQSGGKTVTIETVRDPDETVEQWIERHDAAVQAAMQKWPPGG